MSDLNIFQTIWYRLKYLYKKIKNNPIYTVLLLSIVAIEVTTILIMHPKITYHINEINSPLLQQIYYYIAIAVYIMVGVISFLAVTTPASATKHKTAFEKIKLVNGCNETPILIYQNKIKNNVIYEYYSYGIPVSSFEKFRQEIENTLNITIREIYAANSHRIITIKAKKGKQTAPLYVKWDDAYLPKEENLIALGLDDDGCVYTADLNADPHYFIGGKTGSCKTNLLTLAMYQAMKHNPENHIYLVDMKGGVDFPKTIRDSVHFIDDKVELNEILNNVCEELEARKKAFKDLPYANIGEYNSHITPMMPRIFIFCDEAAVIFSKTKYDAELSKEITKKFEILATQARFSGITIWIQTQRGDAETIPPQIRSNLTKLCGKADDTLSKLTIGSTIASTISDRNKGRFYNEQEQGFASFHFDNKQWL